MFTLTPRRWAGDVVKIRDLCHDFGRGENRSRVLDHVALRLDRGQIVVMTGPSGSGKTTLLTLMGGLRAVQEGSVQVLGSEMASLDAAGLVAMRRRIGFIFQLHNLFDSLSARENVLMALELQEGLTVRERRRRADEALSRLGLGEKLRAKPQRLSGGQRQRVAIARALVHKPQLVLADEPTAALDETSGREVMGLFEELAEEEGCTILIVTHDKRIIEKANRIVNMEKGRVEASLEVAESLSMAASLQRCEAFQGRDLGLLANVVRKAALARVAEGTVFFEPGDPAEAFFIIRAGVVELTRVEPSGAVRREVRSSGEFFGETALITGEPHHSTAVAREDVEVYTLTEADFKEAVRTSPSFKEQLLNAFLSFSH